jgi:hypothetical protein
MVIGHYAVGMVAKRYAPRTSLGTLIAAGAFLDLVWPFFLLLGVEVVEVTPGVTAVTPLTFVSYPWSHSLLMSVVWGALFAAFYFVARRYVPGTIAVAALVVSHWLLDVIMHVPDLPLVPWGGPLLGLGLWRSLPLSMTVELIVFAAGVATYLRSTRARDGEGAWGLAVLIVFMLIIYAAALFGPPPPSASVVAWSDFGQWLVVALAAWVDSHRRTDSTK